MDTDYNWWKKGVIYHIYPRSFYDSNNDGIGDIQGIIQKIPYLKSLGITAVWLSPIYKSPQVDFGYDISNYREIDPIYGNMDDFLHLLFLLHENGIKLIMDMVLNHTSDQHPWFIESRSSTNNLKRDWYIWKEEKRNRVPNNWKNAFGKNAWEYDKTTKAYYYHSFFKEQPDLNWRNKEVKNAMFNEIEFWLKLGVDGIRLDVINMIAKDKKFRNNPTIINQLLNQPKLYTRNRPRSIKIIKSLRKLLDQYDKSISVGEIFTLPPGDSELAASYLGNGKDALHMAFDFSLIFTPWKARKYAKTISKSMGYIPKEGWPCHVFSNHDLNRSYSKPLLKTNRIPIAKLKALLLLTLPGTPFIYYGEEIGMENTKISRKNIVDPMGKVMWPIYKGRDKARTPMQWSKTINSSFTEGKPWLPLNRNYKYTNVDKQIEAEDSLLNLYKTLIKLRNNNSTLQKGSWNLIPTSNRNLLAYKRNINKSELVVVLNFSKIAQKINLLSPFNYMFSTHTNAKIKQNIIGAYEGIIIEPERYIYSL